MITDRFSQGKYIIASLLAVILISAACQPAVLPTSRPVVEGVKTVLPTNTQVVVEPPASPTSPPATPTQAAPAEKKAVDAKSPSATPQPTAVVAADPLASAPEVVAFCLPKDMSVVNYNEPLNPPVAATKATITAESIDLSGLPSNGCVFSYTFTGPVPGGMRLEVSEPNQAKPFLKADLVAVDGHPETVWVLIRHGMVLSPRAALLHVNFVVRGPEGQAVRSDSVAMHSRVEDKPSATQVSDDEEDENCGCGVPLP